MSEHAAFSPSGSEKRYLCPASYAVERDLPDESSAYADEGTDCHELAAACLRTGNPADFYLGKRMSNGYEVTDEMVEAVQTYVNRVLTYAEGHTLLVEQQVNYASFVNAAEDECWGTADAIVITADGEELQLHDAKFGRGVKVDASYAVDEFVELNEDGSPRAPKMKGNRQLMDYALGALNDFGMLGDFKRVRLVIHQPRLNHLSEWDCTIDDLMEFAKEEAYAILQCKNAATLHRTGKLEPTSSYFNPGEKQCRWCAHAGPCDALRAHINREVFGEFDVIETGADPLPAQAETPTQSNQLGRALDAAPLIEHWLKTVRAEAERQAFAGNPPVGKDGSYKLVQGRMGNRKWADDQAAETQLKSMRLKQDEIYTFNLKTPPQIEKLLKPNPRKWAKLQPLITQSEGGISLAPATDKRPPYEPPSAADDFEDLTGDTSDVLSATA